MKNIFGVIGYVNRYRGTKGDIWSGRTIFNSVKEATSVPCASREAYVDTCVLLRLNEDGEVYVKDT